MKKLFQFIIVILIASLSVSCSVKQGELVVVEKHDNTYNSVGGNINMNFNLMPQKINIEKKVDILKKVDPKTVPLAVSSDTGIVIGFEFISSQETDEANSKIASGNMTQPINLYAIDTENREKTFLGKFLSLKDFQFDDTEKLFAFIDGNSNIYIYNIETKQLQNILEGKNNYAYNSLSWSKDSKKLLINQRMTLDISSKQLISFAVDAYNPYIEQKYNNQEIYIVQMKNNEYNDMIALYNFDTKSFKSLANGLFWDSDNISLIYTNQSQSNLFVLNMETLESRPVESGPVYQAKIMKSTGDILYTTLNPDFNSSSRYLLVKLNPSTGAKKSVPLSTPTFYLSPAEDMLNFVGDYNDNKISVETAGLNVLQKVKEKDDPDLFSIKTTILKMFKLDYSFEGSYEEYEKQASKIYANTYAPMPQEALENKLIDFKRFNMPLPTWQREPVIPSTIVLSNYRINGDKASLDIGFFFINSMELAKIDDVWKITGFSTHPDSLEIKEIRNVVQKHINDIKNKDAKEALKYWKDNPISDFRKNQMQIVTDLIENADSYNIEIGEIELWSRSEPHRAENSQTAEDAKVKVILKNKENSKKYKLVLSKNGIRSYTINSWSIDPLSISQLR